ncbi:hypothetical protein C8J57DRAFT_1555913 [Mycena rebaudengoi]|nr:hypothetical protein C8J57DRAFT_1555913 [Mycena rebaudengoi]
MLDIFLWLAFSPPTSIAAVISLQLAHGLARPVLDRQRDQRVPARAAARERGVFEGASFAICTLPSHPSAAASSSRPSAFTFPCRPSDSFPAVLIHPLPFFLPVVISARSVATHTLRLHTRHILPLPSLLFPLLFFVPFSTPRSLLHSFCLTNAHPRHASPPSRRRRILLRETRAMLKHDWMLCVYAVLLMSGASCFFFVGGRPPWERRSRNGSRIPIVCHGFVVLLPSFSSPHPLPHPRPPSPSLPLGAIAGGAFTGWLPQFLGWCITIVCVFFSCEQFGGACVVWAGWVELDERVGRAMRYALRASVFTCLTAVFIPIWILPTSFSALAAGAFCIQFGVGSPSISLSAFRATFPGVTYQLGNLVSSASAQTEATNALAARLLAAMHTFATCTPSRPAHRRAHAGDAHGLYLRCAPHARVLSWSTPPACTDDIRAPLLVGDHLQVPGRVDGKPGTVPDYAKVQGNFFGVGAHSWCSLRPLGQTPKTVHTDDALRRNHGSHFEKHRAMFDEGSGADDTYIDNEGGARPELGNQTVKAASTEKTETAEKTIENQGAVPIDNSN